jgi:hypothetical protein
MPATLLRPEHHWVCPNCTLTQVTYETEPHTRFHGCAGLGGLTAPMVPDGVRCKVEAVVREDYTDEGRSQLCTYDGDGRPISAVVTTREDGNDVAALAPCALGRVG